MAKYGMKRTASRLETEQERGQRQLHGGDVALRERQVGHGDGHGEHDDRQGGGVVEVR